MGEILQATNLIEAPAHFEKSISLAKEINADNELALALAGYGRYYRRKCDTVQDREYLTESLKILERLGTLVEPDKVKEELAQLSEG